MCLGKYTLQPASVRAAHASECAQQAEIPSICKALRALQITYAISASLYTNLSVFSQPRQGSVID